ncbi:mitochondrial transport protein fsf1 [Phytophthora nicotianae]|uniref:Mitochondrial transport protein fsf1 n=1 Tax=Phytophthora nicotianae TaxID=4792 RepID=A0A0W8D356_PHYNI|nr:mitochondrial transport protein fsf1 [Phytophthora nicotianae]
MQIRYAIAWAMVAIQSTDASNSTSKGDLNGWYPCSEYTFSDEGSSTGQVAQCAVYSAPLCYPGICETPPGVNSEVDVFVKRLPATAADPATTTNVWLLQGGPGVLEQFDHDPNSTCAALVNSTVETGESPSANLRIALGNALTNLYARTLIPPVVYRLGRCAPEDMDVLT